MKKYYFLIFTLVLIITLPFQALGNDINSVKTELSTNVYYDLNLKNSDFAYLGSIGISVLGSTPLNSRMQVYYGIKSGMTDLGLDCLAELGVGTEIFIKPGLSIEPVALVDGGITLLLKSNASFFSGGVSGIIRLNKILSDKLNLQLTSGVKYFYLTQGYQYLLIPLEAGIVFKF